jgi:hypothetical protein
MICEQQLKQPMYPLACIVTYKQSKQLISIIQTTFLGKREYIIYYPMKRHNNMKYIT